MSKRSAAGRIVRILCSKRRVKSIEPWQSPAEGPKELSSSKQWSCIASWDIQERFGTATQQQAVRTLSLQQFYSSIVD